MRNFAWGLAALLLVSASVPAAEPTESSAPQSTETLPEWAPGPVRPEASEPPPGRVASKAVGVALTLPESWRNEEVSWRELSTEEAQALSPLAQAGLTIEYKPKKGAPETLLSVYRVALEPWREAARDGKAGEGRLTLTAPEIGFVVVRSDDETARGRFGELRDDLEDAVGTMAQYDAHRENRHLLPRLQTEFAGVLADGSPVSLKLHPNGKMNLSYGKKPRELEGIWFQRGAQVVVWVNIPSVQTGPRFQMAPEMLFHFDGRGLIAITWDEKVMGAPGPRLDPPQ